MGKGFLYKEIQTTQKEEVSEYKADNDTDKREQDKSAAIKVGTGPIKRMSQKKIQN